MTCMRAAVLYARSLPVSCFPTTRCAGKSGGSSFAPGGHACLCAESSMVIRAVETVSVGTCLSLSSPAHTLLHCACMSLPHPARVVQSWWMTTKKAELSAQHEFLKAIYLCVHRIYIAYWRFLMVIRDSMCFQTQQMLACTETPIARRTSTSRHWVAWRRCKGRQVAMSKHWVVEMRRLEGLAPPSCFG